MIRRTQLAILCLVMASFACCVSVSAQPSATDILKKSLHAATVPSFTGRLSTTVYGGNGGPMSAAVKVYQHGPKSRMEYISGPSAGRTVLDDGGHVIWLKSSNKTAYVCETPNPPAQLDLMLRNYSPVLSGSARIAGRDCYVIKLAPRSKCDPSKRLWVDKQSMVTMKTEKCSSEGELECTTVYSSIDYTARPDASVFSIPRGWKTIKLAECPDSNSLGVVCKAVGFTPRKPGYVPKGYTFDDYYLRNSTKVPTFAGLRYTNGLNTISVFERKIAQGGKSGGSDPASSGVCNAGSFLDNPQAHMVHTLAGNLTVLIVGDVAETELRKMANSFK